MNHEFIIKIVVILYVYLNNELVLANLCSPYGIRLSLGTYFKFDSLSNQPTIVLQFNTKETCNQIMVEAYP